MPNCPECGIDVAEEGLCPECSKEYIKDRKTSVSIKHPVVILVLALLALGGGFIVGRLSSASRIPAIETVDSDGIPPGSGEVSSESDGASSESSGVSSDSNGASSESSEVSSDSNGVSSESDGASSESSEVHSESDGVSSDPNGAGNSSSSTSETAAKTEEVLPEYQLSERMDHPPIDDSEEEAYVQWMMSRTNTEESVLRDRWQRSRACKTLYETPDLSKPRIIEAFLRTPREIFARDSNRDRAYDNAALPIGWGQTISGPHMVSRMTEAINPQPDHRVLEIGTGSGYQAAVLAQLSQFIFTIEIVRPLALQTRAITKELYSDYPEYRNIRFKIADGYYGWEVYAPFHRIVVTAGIDHIPPALLKQLAPEGIMVIPVGPPMGQTVLKVTKHVAADGQIALTREDVYRGTSRGNIIFVPFTDSSGEKHSSK